MYSIDTLRSNRILKEFLDSEIQDIEQGTSLFKYLQSLKTNTIYYKGVTYVLSLTYYQDVPQYEIAVVDNANKLFL